MLKKSEIGQLLGRYSKINFNTEPMLIEGMRYPMLFQRNTYELFDVHGSPAELVRHSPTHIFQKFYDDNQYAFSLYLNMNLDSVIEFVLRHYQLRRDWPESFRDKILSQAKRDRYRSTTFQYRSSYQSPLGIRQLQGTLRIVRASKILGEKLPVDESLHIDTPFNGNEKFEIANFAIDKVHNIDAFRELLIQLMIHAKQIQSHSYAHLPEQMVYYTYADAESYRMYLSLGFQPLPPQYPSAKVHGVTFRPIGISTNGILNIPYAMKKSRPYWEENGLKSVVDFFELLKALPTFDAHIYQTIPAGTFFSGA